MTRNLLDQLRDMTVVVADSGDINSIEKYRPQDSTTNPSLIAAAAAMDDYRDIVDGALRGARKTVGDDASHDAVIAVAIDQLAVDFGARILNIVPGRVSTEVDARLSYDTDATVAKAHKLIALYQKVGIGPERVLIKIASTWEGIEAARVLEAEGIHCNMTLLFGLHQAIACADAHVTLISPFVGRILDWHKKNTGRDSYPPPEDPGVISVTEIYNYYKKFGHKTEIMGASFRNMGEITELAGCDLLTIAPSLLQELADTQGNLPRKLSPDKAAGMSIKPIHVTHDVWNQMHADDLMSKEKLAEGIDKFSEALESLEKMLSARLAALS